MFVNHTHFFPARLKPMHTLNQKLLISQNFFKNLKMGKCAIYSRKIL